MELSIPRGYRYQRCHYRAAVYPGTDPRSTPLTVVPDTCSAALLDLGRAFPTVYSPSQTE
jgi:hypothetical protein